MKKVRFSETKTIYLLTKWCETSRESRKGGWMTISLNRQSFEQRIRFISQQIEWCLTPSHRNKVFCMYYLLQ